MGLLDRDYMHERARGSDPFRPPEQPSTSLVWIVLFWVAIAFVVFKFYETAMRDEASQPKPRHAMQAAPVSTPAPSKSALEKVPPQRTVRHCIRNGVATFSDAECEVDFSSSSPRSTGADHAPVVVSAPERTSRPPSTPGQIYLCKAYDGGTFWAEAHCNQHRAHIDRIVPVPAGLPFDQQVRMAEQRRQAARPDAVVAESGPAQVDHRAASRAATCAALEEEIKQIDARARQPQTAYEQDRLAELRKKTRDAQFRLRC